MGQGGNVYGWEESAHDGENNSAIERRGFRGGYWFGSAGGLMATARGNSANPDYENTVIGFRIASVADVGVIPEPSTYVLFGIGAIGMLMVLRRKQAV
jgi:hypothetical protein